MKRAPTARSAAILSTICFSFSVRPTRRFRYARLAETIETRLAAAATTIALIQEERSDAVSSDYYARGSTGGLTPAADDEPHALARTEQQPGLCRENRPGGRMLEASATMAPTFRASETGPRTVVPGPSPLGRSRVLVPSHQRAPLANDIEKVPRRVIHARDLGDPAVLLRRAHARVASRDQAEDGAPRTPFPPSWCRGPAELDSAVAMSPQMTSVPRTPLIGESTIMHPPRPTTRIIKPSTERVLMDPPFCSAIRWGRGAPGSPIVPEPLIGIVPLAFGDPCSLRYAFCVFCGLARPALYNKSTAPVASSRIRTRVSLSRCGRPISVVGLAEV